jgi:hypothetical protein
MGRELWKELPTPCQLQTCKEYAAAAKELEGFQGRMHRAVGKVTGDAWSPFAGDGPFGRRVAFEIGSRIALPTDQAFATTAVLVRALGVLCCVAAGRDMANCDCLFGLIKTVGVNHLKSRLESMTLAEMWPLAAATSSDQPA